MRAGQFDRVIQIQSKGSAANVFGTKLPTWGSPVTLRAQKLENAIVNSESGAREVSDSKITLRTYWTNGITLESRVTYEGQTYKIQSLKEIGRRVGLDITCE